MALENPNFLSQAVSNFGESTILVNIEAKNISKINGNHINFVGEKN